jgi:hypothetical protein
MKRWHEERNLMIRRRREAPWAGEMGSFRKMRPFGCGRARCKLCHFGKLFPERTRAEAKRAAVELELRAG